MRRTVDEGEVKEAMIFNRIIRATPEAWEYEADQRRSDMIVLETGAAKMSSLARPGGGTPTMAEEEASEDLAGAEATWFRAVVDRANWLAGDRPDIQYAVKEICRNMAKPVRGDLQKLVRPGRCLKGAPRCVQC